MKRLAIICLLLAGCVPHLIIKPPPVTIEPSIAPPTVAVDAPALPTITPTPSKEGN